MFRPSPLLSQNVKNMNTEEKKQYVAQLWKHFDKTWENVAVVAKELQAMGYLKDYALAPPSVPDLALTNRKTSEGYGTPSGSTQTIAVTQGRKGRQKKSRQRPEAGHSPNFGAKSSTWHSYGRVQ